MKFPESRTFRPDYGIKGPSRRARNRRYLFFTVGVLAVFIIARLVLRSLGVFQ